MSIRQELSFSCVIDKENKVVYVPLPNFKPTTIESGEAKIADGFLLVELNDGKEKKMIYGLIPEQALELINETEAVIRLIST